MSMWDAVKGFFGINVNTEVVFPYLDLLVPAILFAIIMIVANMFFKGDRNKLLSVALLAILFLYVFFFV